MAGNRWVDACRREWAISKEGSVCGHSPPVVHGVLLLLRSGSRFGVLFGRGAVLRAAVASATAVTAAPFGCLAVRILLRSRVGRSGLRGDLGDRGCGFGRGCRACFGVVAGLAFALALRAAFAARLVAPSRLTVALAGAFAASSGARFALLGGIFRSRTDRSGQFGLADVALDEAFDPVEFRSRR